MSHLPFRFAEGETLLFDKPLTWTSFDVVGKIRWHIKRYLGVKNIKVGHAGTLDPLATGLLVICTGKHTRLLSGLQADEKEYTGTFFLGATTPSYDLETEPENFKPTDGISEEAIVRAAATLTGSIFQEPPLFSAKKVDGKRAYNLARKGKEHVLDKVPVVVSEFQITRVALPEVDFRVVCSKGTYIRSLARDLGAELGCGAYLSALRRTRSGEYSISDAMQVADFVQILEAATAAKKESENLLPLPPDPNRINL
jgi:tRNA pseudouridine55 synthase